jgi:protein-S-isoprenylcysteine O-methyltransferase Ste14
MDLAPSLGLGLLNGWTLLVLFYAVFGIMLLISPREVVARLYERAEWTRRERILSAFGKLFIFAWLLLAVFTPLRLGHPVFIVGLILYLLGLVGMVVALLNFRAAPLDQPVSQGIYRISRNPQQVTILLAFIGISIAIGSWIALILILIGGLWAHLRVVAEERSCLAQYGEAYRRYMKQVPRYFLFF